MAFRNLYSLSCRVKTEASVSARGGEKHLHLVEWQQVLISGKTGSTISENCNYNRTSTENQNRTHTIKVEYSNLLQMTFLFIKVLISHDKCNKNLEAILKMV